MRKKVKLYSFRKTHNVQWSQLCFSLYEENKQHHCDIFIPFKHIICNKHNEVQGIPILSPTCKVITNALLRTTPVTQKRATFKFAQYYVRVVITALISEAWWAWTRCKSKWEFLQISLRNLQFQEILRKRELRKILIFTQQLPCIFGVNGQSM